MTYVLITIDTELSAALFQAGADAESNYAGSIACDGVGVGWQMDRIESHGLRGTYFVDPMPAPGLWPGVIGEIVRPIVRRGHDVQLHLHPEWLAWAGAQPVGARRGRSIGDFTLNDQITLIALARQLLIDAGAPEPVAFRAGNYGANDDTLRALAQLGIAADSSFNPAYLGDPCTIGLPANQVDPVARLGVLEVPVAAIHDRPGRLRHAQVCALSSGEMRAALHHAAATQRPVFTVVTHSFEMRSRDRKRTNRSTMARFESLCRTVADHPALTSGSFADLDALPAPTPPARLPASYARTARRVAAQAIATLAYER